MRTLRLIAHYLFNWNVRPYLLRKGEWTCLRSNLTPRQYRPPLFTLQRWVWNHPHHYCTSWRRLQMIRTVVDGKLQKTHPSELKELEKKEGKKKLKKAIKKSKKTTKKKNAKS